MPKYLTDIKTMVYDEDIQKIMNVTCFKKHHVILALCYLTGARPSELIDLRRKNVDYGADYFRIKLPTLKLANTQGFAVTDRVLSFSRPIGSQANLYVETIISWARQLQPEDRMFVDCSDVRSLNRLMHKLSMAALGKPLSVYHLRHTRLSLLSRAGATLGQIQSFKGASNPASALRYIHAAPIVVKLENQNDHRDLYNSAPIKKQPTSDVKDSQ